MGSKSWLGAYPSLPVCQGEGGAPGCEAADQEKHQVYSWAYSEEIFGPSTAQMAADHALQRKVNIR
jgi:hypothetical protein